MGRYQVLRELGRGGMGVVLEAIGPDGARVALKRLHGADDPDTLLRALRERRIQQDLGDSRGFVPLLDAFEEDGLPVLVMPLLTGGTLADRLGRGALPAAEVVALARPIAGALGRAHARGVIHRDIKPENILFDGEGAPLVADLGLAKHYRRDLEGGAHSMSLTASGEISGTLRYMSPEQFVGSGSLSPAVDVFALGVLMFEALSGGERAFAGDSLAELVSNLIAGNVRPLGALAPEAPRALVALIARCLRPDPAERFADGAALAQALADLEDRTRPAPRALAARGAAGVGGAVVLALGVGLGVHAAAPAERPPASAPASWRLGAAPPEVLAPDLWEAPGTIAAPLRGVTGSPRALAAAFLGEASRQGQGVVRVRYGATHLARALRPVVDEPGLFLAHGVAGPLLEPLDEAVRVRAPAYGGLVHVAVGAARWRDASVEVRFTPRPVPYVDPAKERDALEVGPLWADVRVGNAVLCLRARTGALIAGRGQPFPLDAREHQVELAPLAPRARRVLLDRAPAEKLLDAAGALVPAGEVALELMGGEYDVSAVVVTGRPARPDASALAVVPAVAPSSARLAALVALDGPLQPMGGGPVLALGAPGGDCVRLCLEGDELRLERGARLLAVARAGTGTPAPAVGAAPREERGRLVLERRGHAFVGTWTRAGEADVRVAALDPTPLAAPVRPAYGSSGPRVRFEEATLEPLAEGADVALEALEQAAARGPAAALEHARAAADPRAAWWRGALELARAHAVDGGDEALRGPLATARLRAVLARARSDLRAVAPGLAPAMQEDARARATLAALLAGDVAGAGEEASGLVAAAGVERARALLDALERDAAGAPCLLARLARSYDPAFFFHAAPSQRLASMGVQVSRADLVERVAPDTPGARAGLRARDRVLGLSGTDDLVTVPVAVQRDGARLELRLPLDDVSLAGLAAAVVVAPELQGARRFQEARALMVQPPSLASLRLVQSTLWHAQAAGYPQGYDVEVLAADVSLSLAAAEPDRGRDHAVAALSALRRASALQPAQWAPLARAARLEELLAREESGPARAERLDAALTAALGVASLSPLELRRLGWELAPALADCGQGVRACVLAAAKLAAGEGNPSLQEQLELAARHPALGGAIRAWLDDPRAEADRAYGGVEPRERDLGRYARLALGHDVVPPSDAASDRPCTCSGRASGRRTTSPAPRRRTRSSGTWPGSTPGSTSRAERSEHRRRG